MILASLLSYSQYPATKYLENGDHVVIMTVEQGRAINQKFVVLNDSIVKLNDTIKRKNIDINFLKRQINTKETLIKYNNDSLVVANKEIAFYRNEMKRVEKLEWIDKKVRKKVFWTVGGLGVLWSAMAYLIIKS